MISVMSGISAAYVLQRDGQQDETILEKEISSEEEALSAEKISQTEETKLEEKKAFAEETLFTEEAASGNKKSEEKRDFDL